MRPRYHYEIALKIFKEYVETWGKVEDSPTFDHYCEVTMEEFDKEKNEKRLNMDISGERK